LKNSVTCSFVFNSDYFLFIIIIIIIIIIIKFGITGCYNRLNQRGPIVHLGAKSNLMVMSSPTSNRMVMSPPTHTLNLTWKLWFPQIRNCRAPQCATTTTNQPPNYIRGLFTVLKDTLLFNLNLSFKSLQIHQWCVVTSINEYIN